MCVCVCVCTYLEEGPDDVRGAVAEPPDFEEPVCVCVCVCVCVRGKCERGE
jgi:hypothetical protein